MWYLLLVLAAAPDPEDLRKALEYQYEQRFVQVQAELIKAQEALKQAQSALQQCIALSPDEPPTGPSQTVTPKKTKAQARAAYQAALRLFSEQNWNDALIALENFTREFPKSSLADNAIWLMAECYLQKSEPELARLELVRLLESYPKSERRDAAMQRLKTLDDRQLTEIQRK